MFGLYYVGMNSGVYSYSYTNDMNGDGSSANYIKAILDERKFDREIEIGMILGSGLGETADSVEEKIVIPYRDIPDFPVSTAKGIVQIDQV